MNRDVPDFDRTLRRPGAPIRWLLVAAVAAVFVARMAGGSEAAAAQADPRPPAVRASAVQQPAKTGPRVRGVHWTFRDVEINTLLARLQRFGVEVPVPVAGQVSVRLSAGVTSWRSILRTSAYQVEGQIESAKLTVAGFDLHQFAARMIYNDGALQLTSLRFAVSRPGGGQGSVSGSARVQVRPRGDLTANVSLERIPLSELAELVPQLAGMLAGDAAGHVSAQAPVNKLRDLSAWQGDAHLTLENLSLPHLPPAELIADLHVAGGQATLSHLSIELERLRLNGSGSLALAAPFEFSSRLRLNAPDLGWLATFDPELQPPLKVGGQISATAAVTGKIQSREFRAQGTLAGRGLKAGRLGVERLQVPYDVTAQLLRLNPIQVSLYGGQVGASVNVPFDPQGIAEFGFQWRGLDVGALAADVIGATDDHDVAPNRKLAPGLVPGGSDIDHKTGADAERNQPATTAGATGRERVVEAGWQGQTSGSLQLRAPLDRLRDLDAWAGQGQFRLQNAAAYGMTLPQASLSLRIADGTLRLASISLNSSLGQVTGSARLRLQTPFEFGASLSIANIDLAQANRLPERLRAPLSLAGQAGVSADLRGTLQPFTFAARGAVAARRLQAGQATLDRVDLNYDLDGQKATLSQIVVTGYQGRLTGSVAVQRAAIGLNARLPSKSGGNVLHGVPGAAVGQRSADRGTPQRAFPTESKPLVARASFRAADASDAQVKLDWQRMNIARLLADLNLLESLRGARVEGWSNGSVDATANGPLAEVNSWQVQTESLFWAIRLDQFTLRRAALAARLANGKLTLSKIEADEGPMRLNAAAHIALSDAADFDAHLRLRRADLAMLNRLPPRLRPPVAVVGTASVAADVQGTLDPLQLNQGDVDASLAGLSAFGWTGASARLQSRVRDGMLEVTHLSARQGQTTVEGSGRLDMAAPFDYQARLTVNDVDLARLNTLPETVRPPVKLAGVFGLTASVSGTLDPMIATGEGSLTARHLEADGAKIDRVEMELAADKEQLSLSRLAIQLYDGQIKGSATVPLNQQGAGRVQIAWSEIDLGRLATDIARPPVRLSGKIDGNIDAEIPPGKLARIAAWNIDARFDVPQLTADSVPIGQLQGRLAYHDGLARYNMSGEALKGKLQIAGAWQPAPPDGRHGQNEGNLQLTGARLAALDPLLRQRGAADTLSGTLSLNVNYHHDADTGQPLGSGDLALDDVQYEGIDLLDEVRGQIRMLPNQMDVANVSGIVAGGQLLGSATVFLQPGRRSSFLLAIDGAEAADALSFWPRLAAQTRGTVDAQVRGFFGMGRPIYVNGAAAVRQGRFDGLEFSGARLPISGVLDPASGTGQLHLHGATAQVALGRVVGDFDVTLTSMGIDLSGKGKFTRVDMRTLLRRVAAARRLGSGKISGKYTLAGRNVRSVRDLTGTVDADLTNAQAMSFPVLQGILPYLTGGISGSTTFNSGDVRARLAGGVIRVDEFSLASNAAQLYARGTVSLAGRLNLNVTVNTGQLNPSARAVSVLAARIALFTAPPVALLLEASQFLSNQVINVEVTGTIRSPTIRIRPLPLLEQEVIQFFLLQTPGV